jgi:hypothetical protein
MQRLLFTLALSGCMGPMGDASEAGAPDAASLCPADRYVSEVVSFAPGEGAGFGADAMPGVVMGPPQGRGDFAGSLDVVSLGAGGEIVLGFSVDIVDGDGDDFIVFENAFQVPGAPPRYWEELAEVAVSDDGQRWSTFPCDPRGDRPHTHCAGWNPVYASSASGYCASDPRVSGGDGFDLRTVGLRRARFVRIRDLRTHPPAPPTTGFDLDAVAVVHAARRTP